MPVTDIEIERVIAMLRSDSAQWFDIGAVVAVIEGLRDEVIRLREQTSGCWGDP